MIHELGDAIRLCEAHLGHEVLKTWRGPYHMYAMTRTFYGDHAPHTGVEAGTCVEVWRGCYEYPIDWELVDPHCGDESTPLWDYDPFYEPTPVELLAIAGM